MIQLVLATQSRRGTFGEQWQRQVVKSASDAWMKLSKRECFARWWGQQARIPHVEGYSGVGVGVEG